VQARDPGADHRCRSSATIIDVCRPITFLVRKLLKLLRTGPSPALGPESVHKR
jgi:hypothetical protein